MNQYVGLDVSLKQTAICVVDDDGKPLWQGKCASTPEMLVAIIRTRAPQVARIGLESGPLSLWHWHALKQAGLPVVCLDARHAKAALSLQLNKSGLSRTFAAPFGFFFLGLSPGLMLPPARGGAADQSKRGHTSGV